MSREQAETTLRQDIEYAWEPWLDKDTIPQSKFSRVIRNALAPSLIGQYKEAALVLLRKFIKDDDIDEDELDELADSAMTKHSAWIASLVTETTTKWIEDDQNPGRAFSRERAELIAITEITRARTMGEMAAAELLSEVDVILVGTWITMEDELVCEVCGPLHLTPESYWSEFFPNGSPAHPRCRCMIDWKEKAKRPSKRTKQVGRMGKRSRPKKVFSRMRRRSAEAVEGFEVIIGTSLVEGGVGSGITGHRTFRQKKAKEKNGTSVSRSSARTRAERLSNRRGLRGKPVRMEAPNNANRPNKGQPIEGLPVNPINIKGYGEVTPGPFETARDIARDYVDSTGMEYNPPTKYIKVDPARAKLIAEEFDRMEHKPDDPAVKRAYDALIKETVAQYQFIKKTGLKIDVIDYAKTGDPYAASPRMATDDVVKNNHLWFFPTDAGFGSGDDYSNNPLLEPTDEYVGKHRLVANDVFRIVHDYFGHVKEGNGFRADGEDNAWRSHSAMFSPEARKALTTETRGQNSWVNFGPYSAKNRIASGESTHFAAQKIGLLPDWIVNDSANINESLQEGGVGSGITGHRTIRATTATTTKTDIPVMSERAMKAWSEEYTAKLASMLNVDQWDIIEMMSKDEALVSGPGAAEREYNWLKNRVEKWGNKPHKWEMADSTDGQNNEVRKAFREKLVVTLRNSETITNTDKARFLANIHLAMDTLPDEVMKRASDSIKHAEWYHDLNSMTKTMAPHIKGGVIGGCWDTVSSTIHLDGNYLGKAGDEATATTVGVYRHEIAHSVDYDSATGMAISRGEDWQRAFRKEIRIETPTTDGETSVEKPLSNYAATSFSEGFAEFARHVWSGKNMRSIEVQFPESVAIFRKHGLVK